MLYKLENSNNPVFEYEVILHKNLADALISKNTNESVKLINKDILGTKNEIIKHFDIINNY